jgi:putative membrane protein
MFGYGPRWGMMGGWDGYGWMGPLHVVFWIVVLVLIVALAVWLLRSFSRGRAPLTHERRSPGLDVLEQRYARGEIEREEYLQKKRDMSD